MTRRDAILLTTAFPLALQAQTPVSPMTLLEAEAEMILARATQELASRDAWEPLHAKRRRELQDMLGLDPWPDRTPLNAQITGKLDQADYQIEKIAFESIPKFYVTANLYLPKPRTGPVPVIVYVCGHTGPAQGAKVAYQRHGISFARNGYACFILDPIQIAELYSLHHGVRAMQYWDWYSRGYTPAGVETWNAIRAFDYLASRPEVDMSRAGMTGRSGGAAITWFTAALDDRIKVAAPIMGNSTYLANLRENTQRGHCDCMFTLNFHRHEMAHQGALIAPRPLLMAHGRKDTLFPIPGFTRFEELMRGLYGSYQHPERFRNIVVDTGHADSDYLREEAMRWFDTHLLGTPGRTLKMSYENAPAESLAVFQGSPPKDAINAKVDLAFRPAAKPVLPPDRAAWQKRRAELMGLLKDKVFAGLRIPAASEPPAAGSALIYIVPSGEDASGTSDFFRFAQLPLYDKKILLSPLARTERDLLRNAMHVGLTPDTLRMADVIRTVQSANTARITVVGKGTDAGVAIYAAIFEPRITEVVLVDPPESHWQGPVFLNVLRYTDLPEAAALLAPRPIHFLHQTPPAYGFTKRVYELMA